AALEPRVQEAASSLAELVERRQETELRAALARQRSDDLVRQLERAQQVLRAHGDELAQRRAAEAELAMQPALINEERRQWTETSEGLRAELGVLESAQLPDGETLTALEAQLREDEQRNVTLQVELAHADDAWTAATASWHSSATWKPRRRSSTSSGNGSRMKSIPGSAPSSSRWPSTSRNSLPSSSRAAGRRYASSRRRRATPSMTAWRSWRRRPARDCSHSRSFRVANGR